MTGLWIFNTWHLFKYNATPLQKIMTIVPVLKFLSCLITEFWLAGCPWNTDMMSMQYLLMAKISLSTIYQTIFLALLLLIAKVKPPSNKRDGPLSETLYLETKQQESQC